ncbi:MAG: PAS domain S-box protein [Methanomassiliicoccus sp.]|nr:PAS domain S-box protein [Methanomassiliicoccus sp.]
MDRSSFRIEKMENGPPMLQSDPINGPGDKVDEGIWILDPGGRIGLVNDRGAALLGYDPQEMTGRPVSDFLAPVERPGLRERPGCQEVRARRKDGSGIWISYRSSPLLSEGGRLGGTLVALREVPASPGPEGPYEGEARYRSLFNNLTEAFQVVEVIFEEGKPVDYRYREVNPAFERLTGKGREQLIGHTVREIFGMVEDRWLDTYARIVRTGEPETFEEYGAALGMWYEVHAWKAGRGQCANTFSDITERKRMEETLRESETRYRSLFESLHEGVSLQRYILDDHGEVIDWTILKVNPAMERALRKSRDEMEGRNFSDFYGSAMPFFLPFVRKVRASGEPITIEHFVKLSNRYYLNVIVPLDRDSFLLSIVDITEVKVSEEAMRRAEERLRFHVENAPQAVIEWDADFVVTRWAGEAERMFGWTAEETIGKRIMELGIVYPEDLTIVESAMSRLTDRASTKVVSSNRNLTKGGQVIYCTWYNTVFGNESGKMVSVLSLVVDNTARVKAEEELRRSNAELQLFAYVASHDMQEPLRMVTSYIDLLEHRYGQELSPRAREYMAYAVRGAQRMRDLVNDLLAYSRVDMATKPYARVDLNEVMGEVVEHLREAIASNGAEVAVERLPTVWADRTQMGQVLQNLVSNAIKFHGAAPPRVQVFAYLRGEEWVMGVRDNGIGIDPKYAEKLFNMFQRLHTHDEYPGTGIGLAISRKIVERHGGRIWFESEPGKGSTFFFSIPMSA